MRCRNYPVSLLPSLFLGTNLAKSEWLGSSWCCRHVLLCCVDAAQHVDLPLTVSFISVRNCCITFVSSGLICCWNVTISAAVTMSQFCCCWSFESFRAVMSLDDTPLSCQTQLCFVTTLSKRECAGASVTSFADWHALCRSQVCMQIISDAEREREKKNQRRKDATANFCGAVLRSQFHTCEHNMSCRSKVHCDPDLHPCVSHISFFLEFWP